MFSGLKRIKICAVAAACAAGMFFGAADAHAGAIVQYSFPSSWNGTGTTVTDLSSAANNGAVKATMTLASDIPSGATAGTSSIVTNAGNIVTNATTLLGNSAVAANQGFSYETWFKWDGTATNKNTQKIIDYAGTESLQLYNPNGVSTVAGMVAQFAFNDADDGTAIATNSIILPVTANTWYHAICTFDSGTNTVAGDGSLAGTATFTLDDGTTSVSQTLAVTKTNAGDAFVRPIGFGRLGLSTSTTLVPFDGDIYNPTVSLGVVPEPASLGLLSLGALGFIRRRRR